GLPHWHEKADVALLTQILLGDLQLDRLIRIAQRAEQRRGWFAHLEVDRAVFDLDDGIRVELAVEWMEVVIGGAGAVVFWLAPIHEIVVDEAAVEDHTVMRCERPRDHI